MNGYGRVIYAHTGDCEVGFMIDDEPQGKFCHYEWNGCINKHEEGIYENGKLIQQMKIKSFEQPIITQRKKDEIKANA